MHDPIVDELPRLSNSVRLLVRIIPIIFELTEDSEFITKFFWENMLPNKQEGSSTIVWEPLPVADTTLPLGTTLVHAVMNALFVGEYTVTAEQIYSFGSKLAVSRAKAQALEEAKLKAQEAREQQQQNNGNNNEEEIQDPPEEIIPDEKNAVWPSLLWKSGVGAPDLTVYPVSATIIENRIDVLRLLIALCSGPLYISPKPQSPAQSKFLDAATSPTCPFAPTLFYCLINTILAYDPVGFGVPYASTLVKDKEAPLVALSIQLLLALLDYSPLIPMETTLEEDSENKTPNDNYDNNENTNTKEATQITMVPQFNQYRYLSGNHIQSAVDFEYLYLGITRLLSTVSNNEQSFLPGAYNPPVFTQELLVLLWKLLDDNIEFFNYVLTHCDITLIVGPILYLMWVGRNSITKVGLIHLCTFLCLLLSGERSFGVGLNRPFTVKPPPEFPLLEGSYADYLIIVLHKLVVDGSQKLASLYSCFLTIISNISPYIKNLSIGSAVRLVNLFELFAAPRFLYARPTNYGYVQQLLETFNNLIQYQYESNAVLVYSILRQHEVFENLNSGTVSGWRAKLALKSAKKKAVKTGAPVTLEVTASPNGITLTEGNTNTRTRGNTSEDNKDAAINALAEKHENHGISSSTPVSTTSTTTTAGNVNNSTPWVATDEWLDNIRKQLPLTPTLRLINYLVPLVEAYIQDNGGVVDDEAVVGFLKSSTVVGVLPVPHPILMRKYQPNEYTSLWFTTFLWSTIFLHLCKELPMFDAEAIKLFSITVV